MGQVSTQEYLDGIQKGLVQQLSANKNALPEGFQKDRFILNCITMISDMMRDQKKRESLSKVDPTTIPLCFLKGAILGLDFFNGECYAIPYGKEMKFQTDYKGEIKLNKKYSKNPIRDIFAKVVRSGDEFYEEVSGGDQNIYFKPLPFNNGEMVGAFAVIKYKDGSMQYETMSSEEIEAIRTNFSKMANSTAWKHTKGEMYKKTVLRRLCKFVDLDFDNVDQMKAYEDGGDVDFNKPEQTMIEGSRTVNVFGDPGKQPAALPQKSEPVQNAVKQAQEYQKPEPVEVFSGQVEDEYAQFEQQFNGAELPFR